MARGKNPLLKKLTGNLGDYSVAQVNGQAQLRERPARKTRIRLTNSQQQGLFGGLAQSWSPLGLVVQSGWLALGQQMTGSTGRALTGFQAYMTVNTALATIGSASVTEAPSAPAPPALLPPVLLSAEVQDGGSVFHISLSSATYADKVIVSGAAPVAAAQETLPATAFVTLGVVPGLSSSTDLTALYTARFGVPPVGSQIAVRLEAISATGFRGIPRVVPTVVTAEAARAASDGEGLLKAA